MQMVSREVITEGDGKTYPQEGDSLSVHYEGKLAREGTKFDSSYDRGEPMTFVIGEGQVHALHTHICIQWIYLYTIEYIHCICIQLCISLRVHAWQVIKGWDRGIMEMSLGEKATLNIGTPNISHCTA
jgi:FKBP-type peptidyl-prolyl cis-trans isomerase